MKKLGVFSKRDLGYKCRCCTNNQDRDKKYGRRKERRLIKVKLRSYCSKKV